MTTLELDAFKAELMDEITRDVRNAKSETDVYQRLQDMLRRRMSGMSGYITRQAKAWGKVPEPVPYTAYQPGEREQVSEDIAAFEAERKAGIPGIPADEAAEWLEKEFPWLK